MERNADNVWKKCLQIIKDNVSGQSFKTWFVPIRPVKLDDKVLTIEVPSQFFYEWLEEHYIALLRKTIRNQLGNEGRLEYSIVMQPGVEGKSKPYTVKFPARNQVEVKNPVPVSVAAAGTIRNPFVIPGLKKINVDSQLNPNYTFDTFIEGECNRHRD